jgi:hypothetical protein
VIRIRACLQACRNGLHINAPSGAEDRNIEFFRNLLGTIAKLRPVLLEAHSSELAATVESSNSDPTQLEIANDFPRTKPVTPISIFLPHFPPRLRASVAK